MGEQPYLLRNTDQISGFFLWAIDQERGRSDVEKSIGKGRDIERKEERL